MAAELFRRANAARKAGALERARRDYARLIERFPESEQAQLARISLGKLLLAGGSAGDAEREFQRYLSRGEGQLSEEALLNRAHTLQSLQRADDERSSWETLLRVYPNSVYASQARRRLEALEAPARTRSGPDP